ncbi:MAG TPA: hypothetical protein VG366_02215, partial [Solirubrobacteraceae bacterium]|nr:hypothetical protein [Solirubrobacteraceae bacterium]
ERRGGAERALSERAERHDALARRLYEARSARERLGLRAEQALAAGQALARRVERAERQLAELRSSAAETGRDADAPAPGAAERIAALEAELAEIARRREQELGREVAELEAELGRQRAQVHDDERALAIARESRAAADAGAEQARGRLTAAEQGAQDARRESARVDAELAAANQFLRGHTRAAGSAQGSAPALSEELRVEDGYELALAAALGGRLDAALVADVAGAESVLDRSGPDGGTALLAAPDAPDAIRGATPIGDSSEPAPGARRLLDLLSGAPAVLELAARLLADAWVVERLEDLPRDFGGIAATRSGRVWFAAWGEVRQLSEGGSERVLARRNERDRLIAAAELAAQAEHDARAACDRAVEQVRAAEGARTSADGVVRESERRQSESGEALRRSEWLIEQRRAAPADGPLAVRKAELEGELSGERRAAERLERERTQRLALEQRLRAQLAADAAAAPRAARLEAVLAEADAAVLERLEQLEAELAADRLAGEEMAGELRECAAQAAEIQTALRAAGETVTEAEVAAQRLRDQASEADSELAEVAARLGSTAPTPGDERGEALDEEAIAGLRTRLERLGRRREQLGPVNPLAQEEYAEAVAHVEELEGQRVDLETALRELRSVIRETDRQIEETFEQTFQAAARNFEELVGDVFPGGSGCLRLVSEENAQRAVLGGQPLPASGDGEASEAAAEAEADSEAELRAGEEELPGVEIEITPAGKSTKRLSLLSGGEKSMTALAFLFAVFLARPCPFYILDEVEAALDDLNLDRFLALLRRHSGRAQFIVITHQKRTMEAADWLYGVSMGQDGVSKVLSRRLPQEEDSSEQVAEVA